MPSIDTNFIVRDATLRDVPAISAVHRGSDGPWVDPVECAIFVNHRLKRPFLCHVAERCGEVVGHAEWIVGKEPDLPGPLLYLGMLQVREDCQGQGVGRHMIDYGAKLALQKGCDRLRTVPDNDAVGFYARCGFETVGSTVSCRLRVREGARPPGWKRGRTVPERISRELPLRLGRVQACSTHMWEICNRPGEAAGDTFSHPCLMRSDGQAYVQLRFWEPSQALVVAWSKPEDAIEELLAAAMHLGSICSISFLAIVLRKEDAGSLPEDAESCDEIPVVEKLLSKRVEIT